MVCGRSTYRLDYSLPKVQLAITTGWHYCALHIERSKDRRAQCFNLPAYPLLVNVIFFLSDQCYVCMDAYVLQQEMEYWSFAYPVWLYTYAAHSIYQLCTTYRRQRESFGTVPILLYPVSLGRRYSPLVSQKWTTPPGVNERHASMPPCTRWGVGGQVGSYRIYMKKVSFLYILPWELISG